MIKLKDLLNEDGDLNNNGYPDGSEREHNSKLNKVSSLDDYIKGKNSSVTGYKLSKSTNPDEVLKDVHHVDGYLDVSRSTIMTLPDNLEVDGYLDLSKTKIKNLPNNLVVNGDLILLHCKYLSSFPANLTVRGNMVLNSTAFTETALKKQLPAVRHIVIMPDYSK